MQPFINSIVSIYKGPIHWVTQCGYHLERRPDLHVAIQLYSIARCHVTYGACHVTYGACHVTYGACHVTYGACHVTYGACHVTYGACHVTYGARRIRGLATLTGELTAAGVCQVS